VDKLSLLPWMESGILISGECQLSQHQLSPKLFQKLY